MAVEIEETTSEKVAKLKEENERQLRDLAHQLATCSVRYVLNIEEKKASRNNQQLFIAFEENW